MDLKFFSIPKGWLVQVYLWLPNQEKVYGAKNTHMLPSNPIDKKHTILHTECSYHIHTNHTAEITSAQYHHYNKKTIFASIRHAHVFSFISFLLPYFNVSINGYTPHCLSKEITGAKISIRTKGKHIIISLILINISCHTSEYPYCIFSTSSIWGYASINIETSHPYCPIFLT